MFFEKICAGLKTGAFKMTAPAGRGIDGPGEK
jgi:hypothetical protein